MGARLDYMTRCGLLDPNPARARGVQAVVDDAYRLRLVVLRWRRDRVDGTLERAADTLRHLAAREFEILGSLLHDLDAHRDAALPLAA